MNSRKYKIVLTIGLLLTSVFSCKDLDELNVNPNGVDPTTAHPNLLMATVMTELGKKVVDLGFGDIAGVMQHTQKDGWSGGHNNYEWDLTSGQSNWSSYYSILRTNDEMLQKAEDGELDFHKGVALVLGSYTFGLITDLWGDAPYSAALKGELGGEENLKPVYDNQREIYMGILADLETANTLLSGNQADYTGIEPSQDVFFSGNVSKWQKFANSLALRYYMRISNKEEAMAKAGIEKIVNDPANYPIITEAGDDVLMDYIGASPADAWPTNTVFDPDPSGSYMRIKMCATLVEAMQALDDPRIELWANRVTTPIVIDTTLADDTDFIEDGVRYVAQNIVDDYEANFLEEVNTDPEWVGLPTSSPSGGTFNLNPDLAQGTFNPHASHLNDIYKATNGPLLKSRLMTAAEVHFILAEAAFKGWNVGDAEALYNAGIEQSFNAWGIGNKFDDYIANAPYAGLEEIIEQKWIASWSAAAEAWFDYRRTGLPALGTGPYAQRQAIPLRFYYMEEEITLNPVNAGTAIEGLNMTEFAAPDPKNSAWSKSWLLEGTGLPY